MRPALRAERGMPGCLGDAERAWSRTSPSHPERRSTWLSEARALASAAVEAVAAAPLSILGASQMYWRSRQQEAVGQRAQLAGSTAARALQQRTDRVTSVARAALPVAVATVVVGVVGERVVKVLAVVVGKTRAELPAPRSVAGAAAWSDHKEERGALRVASEVVVHRQGVRPGVVGADITAVVVPRRLSLAQLELLAAAEARR
jgi:hypothetical protein